MWPAWQAFKREGKWDFGCERSAKGARGRREGNLSLIPSLLRRAWSRAKIPFPSHYERLPGRIVILILDHYPF